MLFALVDAAHADGVISELRIGGVVHDVPGLWSGFSYERRTIDVNIEALLSTSLPVLGGAVRPALGATINTRGDTSHLYADARWQIELPAGFFLGLGAGAAIHDGHLGPDSQYRKALGSRVLFHFPAEFGYRLDAHHSLSVYFEHTSNANLADLNEGLDRLGVRYGYRF
jgi:lipid A 3-O-deacylase